MKRLLPLTLMALFLTSCKSADEDRNNVFVYLSGERMEICEDAPVFEIVYANDTSLVASLLSNENRLGIYHIGGQGKFHEFLKAGRGPMEVTAATVVAKDDTLHAMAYGPHGISCIIRIPVKSIADMSAWERTDYSGTGNIQAGMGFCMKSQDEYIVLGDRLGEKNIMSILQRNPATCAQASFWPQDGFEGPEIAKQTLYMLTSKVFCKDDKVLYACGEGRYVSIITMGASGAMSEQKIYDEFPEYSVDKDRVNWKRSIKSRTGVMAFATDSLIYLSPREARIVNGRYVPDNYNGYPPYFNDRIDVYGWDGNYIKTLCLNIPFGTFYVTDDDKFIFTVTENRESLISEIYRCGIIINH
ncbi:MAG: hypothetical protein NC115_08090 [Bacteroidales bacterium]|nr:hypothetical protein [Bacteroidales bacterium]